MSIYDSLNREQRQAVECVEGPLLILAGAGSGKTRVLTHRIAYLIEEMGVNPWSILAITFTNKAAEEMRERVDSLVGFGAEQIWVTTFHSTCIRILRRHIDLLGYDNNFTVYDADDQKTVMKNVCKKLNIDTKNYKEKTILKAISSAKDELISVSEYEMKTFGDFTKVVFAKAYREYQDTLKRSNALDFDDIIVKTVELFRTHPEVLENYQNRFRYICVDEYQDTNSAQFQLIHLLASKHKNLCVVGDDDQSIYRFRGANIRNILDFEQYYPEATVIKLEQNYRSTQSILDAANAVIANNVGRKVKSLWTDNGEGERIHFSQLDNAYEEAEFIVGDIRSRVRNEDASYGDFSVLYRTNAQARLIEEQLVMKGIPYNVVGGTNFYSRAEIKDMIAYLKTIENGLDEVALRRIINVPKRKIGAASLDKMEDYADMRDISLFDAMCYVRDITGMGKAATQVEGFVNLISVLRAGLASRGIAGTLRAIIEQTGYENYLYEQDEESAEDRMDNVMELINKAQSFEETNEAPTLTEFLEEVALVSDLDNVESGDQRVLLMTLHSAKGLEFPQVYLAGMEDGLFPSFASISSEDSNELEEERRLAYVGITRAKQRLTITCAKMRMLRGETQFNPISVFVREIPSELVDGYIPGKKKSISNTSYDEFGDRSASYGMGKTVGHIGGNVVNATLGKPRASVKSRAGQAPEDRKPFALTGAGMGAVGTGLAGLGAAGIQKGMAGMSDAELSYGVGDRVRHVKFGEGTVLAIEKEPRDYKVKVDFDTQGPKIMYAGFAKLEKI